MTDVPAPPDVHTDPSDFFKWLVGRPVTITSGLRSAAHNRAVGGSPTSEHLTGNAWDIQVPGESDADVIAAIRRSGVPFDQLIDEGNHVHFGLRPGANRNQVLKMGGGMPATTTTEAPTGGMPPYMQALLAPDARQKALEARESASATAAGEALTEEQKTLKGIQSRSAERQAQEAGVHVPEAPQIPTPPKEEPGNPTRVLQETLPMLAILAGALGGGHAMAAMKAATAAMKAAKTGDEDAIKRHHDQWMDSMEQIKTNYELRRTEFDDFMKKLDTNRNEAIADATVAESIAGTSVQKAALDSGQLDKYIDLKRQELYAYTQATGVYNQAQQMELERKRFEETVKHDRAGEEDTRARIPPATQAYNDAIKAGKTPEEAAEAAGKVARQVRAGSLQAEYGDENKIRNELIKKGSPGEAYQAIKVNATKIADAAAHPENYISPAGTAIVADTFTRAFNGGNAIRGFQAKMLSDDRSLVNNLTSILQRAENGGKFTPQEIKSMANAVLRVQPELKSNFQQSASDAIALARSRGEDPHAVIPLGMRDDVDFGSDNAIDAAPTDEALPLPSSKADLVKGQTYQTSQGPGVWDGAHFEVP